MLKPFLNNDITPEPEVVEELPPELQESLEAVGLANAKSNSDKDEIRKIFDKHGAGIENIAAEVAKIMQRGEQEASRLKACQMAMEVQGIISTIEEKQAPVIHINIIGSGNNTLVNLVCPDVK